MTDFDFITKFLELDIDEFFLENIYWAIEHNDLDEYWIEVGAVAMLFYLYDRHG